MVPLHLYRRTAPIVVRLRLALWSVTMALVIAGTLGLSQAKTIMSAYDTLNQSAIPLLKLVQRTEGGLVNLATALGLVADSTSEREIAEAQRRVKERVAKTRDDLSALAEFNVPAHMIASLNDRLGRAEQTVLKTLSNRAHFLRVQEQLESTLAEMVATQRKSEQTLDRLTAVTEISAEELLKLSQPPSGADDDDLRTQLAVLFRYRQNLSAIDLSVGFIINAALENGVQGRERPSQQMLTKTEHEFSEGMKRLTLITDRGARESLSGDLAHLKRLVSGPEGVFAKQARQFQLKRQFNLSRAMHIPLLATLSEVATELVDESQTVVDQASAHLNHAIQSLAWILAGALSFSIGIVFFTNRVVVERQFNQRIRELNEAVHAVANGDLSHPIPVSGRDELREMADALVIFRENANELQRSNVELEKFAYVAAHDLRAPLRAIQDLSSWTLEDRENRLSAESRSYLTLLQGRTARLDRLLTDLLTYARAGTEMPPPQEIDLHFFVQEQAQYVDPERAYRIEYIGPEYVIKVASTPLQQVLSNLLTNAVKHHDQVEGKITVAANVTSDILRLEITDDGPGIEPQYQNRIFGVFQTLRSRDEIDSSGIGLAIVKKVVEAEKGTLQLISNPVAQRGTTFVITLPHLGARNLRLHPQAA